MNIESNNNSGSTEGNKNNSEGEIGSKKENQEQGMELSSEKEPSKDDTEEKELGSLYEKIDKKESLIKKLEEEQKKIEEIRAKLERTTPAENESLTESIKELQDLRNQLTEAENDFLELPSDEEMSDGDIFEKSSDEELDEYKEKDSLENKKKFVEQMVEAMVKANKEVFDESENGDKAEILFRKKLENYLVKAEKGEYTYSRIRTVYYQKPNGEKTIYIHQIFVENGDKDFSFDESELKEERLYENDNKENEQKIGDADPELMNKREVKYMQDLSGKP